MKSNYLANSAELGVVAAGFSGGQPKPGVAIGPSALIAGGLLTQLEQDLRYTLVHGDVIHIYLSLIPFEDPVYKNMNRPLAVSAVNKRISEQVYEQARQGRYVLTLGGDHSISIGTLAGTAKATRERLPGKELAVLWVDAHADINTPDTTISGNIHGMALAFSTGLAKGDREDVFGWLGKEQLIDKKRLVYIALRDLDEAEEVILKENDIKRFKMADVERDGIERVVDLALDYIGADSPIHLSFDIDALDPSEAPSTGTSVPGGLTLEQGTYIGKRVHETGNLVAMELVEVNPELAPEGAAKTVAAGVSLVRSALGHAAV
ncbi:Arginase, catabolizes arginine to ornithine and urea [Lobaria immixta]|nr:Arginase, catabolizes arginine to ornithine and urea [Lobaria immixta]